MSLGPVALRTSYELRIFEDGRRFPGPCDGAGAKDGGVRCDFRTVTCLRVGDARGDFGHVFQDVYWASQVRMRPAGMLVSGVGD